MGHRIRGLSGHDDPARLSRRLGGHAGSESVLRDARSQKSLFNLLSPSYSEEARDARQTDRANCCETGSWREVSLTHAFWQDIEPFMAVLSVRLEARCALRTAGSACISASPAPFEYCKVPCWIVVIGSPKIAVSRARASGSQVIHGDRHQGPSPFDGYVERKRSLNCSSDFNTSEAV